MAGENIRRSLLTTYLAISNKKAASLQDFSAQEICREEYSLPLEKISAIIFFKEVMTVKKKNAFAFRDFNAEKILQRRFFKDFREENQIGDMTDTEILKSLTAADEDTFEITQQKFDTLDTLLVKAAEYQKRIKRHGERLTRYTRALEYKIATDETASIAVLRSRHKRANELSMKYCGCVTASGVTSFFGGICIMDIGGLIQEIAKRYKILGEEIKAHYRKIFAARLRQTRKEMKLTQAELGTRLGLSQRAVSNYEKAEREPSINMLVRVSKEFNRPINWFLET